MTDTPTTDIAVDDIPQAARQLVCDATQLLAQAEQLRSRHDAMANLLADSFPNTPEGDDAALQARERSGLYDVDAALCGLANILNGGIHMDDRDETFLRGFAADLEEDCAPEDIDHEARARTAPYSPGMNDLASELAERRQRLEQIVDEIQGLIGDGELRLTRAELTAVDDAGLHPLAAAVDLYALVLHVIRAYTAPDSELFAGIREQLNLNRETR